MSQGGFGVKKLEKWTLKKIVMGLDNIGEWSQWPADLHQQSDQIKRRLAVELDILEKPFAEELQYQVSNDGVMFVSKCPSA